MTPKAGSLYIKIAKARNEYPPSTNYISCAPSGLATIKSYLETDRLFVIVICRNCVEQDNQRGNKFSSLELNELFFLASMKF
jgi:hypothetical protein